MLERKRCWVSWYLNPELLWTVINTLNILVAMVKFAIFSDCKSIIFHQFTEHVINHFLLDKKQTVGLWVIRVCSQFLMSLSSLSRDTGARTTPSSASSAFLSSSGRGPCLPLLLRGGRWPQLMALLRAGDTSAVQTVTRCDETAAGRLWAVLSRAVDRAIL